MRGCTVCAFYVQRVTILVTLSKERSGSTTAVLQLAHFCDGHCTISVYIYLHAHQYFHAMYCTCKEKNV